MLEHACNLILSLKQNWNERAVNLSCFSLFPRNMSVSEHFKFKMLMLITIVYKRLTSFKTH